MAATQPTHRAIALTVAGSDSGGGAGIQADLKTFEAMGVHGTSAITCITAQNPRRVAMVVRVPSGMLRAQLEAVFAELPPGAVKTGMLYSAENIRVVADFFSGRRAAPPLVVDPVMIATSGARLLAPGAVRLLLERLLPLATLVTPNLDEAAVLTGRPEPINTVAAMRTAARVIHRRFGVAVLLKGGHRPGARRAVDVFFDGRRERILSARFVTGIQTHGTGCTYSAAICAGLAAGCELEAAVVAAKKAMTAAISGSYLAAGHWVLFPGAAGQKFGRTRRK